MILPTVAVVICNCERLDRRCPAGATRRACRSLGVDKPRTRNWARLALSRGKKFVADLYVTLTLYMS